VTDRRLPLRLAIAAALGLAILLRLWDLAGRPLWLDESWSRWMTEQSWTGLSASARRYDTHPPLYYALLKLWNGAVLPTPLAMRVPSLVAGLAMLPLAWFAARRIGPLQQEKWAAPLLMFAVAAAPALVIASRQARPYALFALAFAAALCAALAIVARQDDRFRNGPWFVYLAAIALVLWLHALGILFVAALGGGLFLALALQGALKKAWLPFIGVHVLALVVWIPCLLILMEQRRVWSHGWLRFNPRDLPYDLAQGLAAPGIAGLFVLALAVLGAVTLARSRVERPAAILLCCAAVGPALATIFLSIVSSPVFLPRTLVPSVLPTLLLAAAAVTSIGAARTRALAAAAMFGLLAATSLAEVSRPPEERWAVLASWLHDHVGPGEEVWLLPNELALPLDYAARGTNWRDLAAAGPFPVRGIPAPFPAPEHPAPRYTGTMAVPGMGPGDADRLVREARARGTTGIWVVSRFESWFDPAATLRHALGAPDSSETGLAPLIVHHYRLRPQAVTPRRG